MADRVENRFRDSDGFAVAVALSATAGAHIARDGPVIGAAILVLVSVAFRRPVLLLAGVLVLTSGMAARSERGLTLPAVGQWTGWATIVRDPVPGRSGVTVELRVGSKRVRASANGPPAWSLSPRLVGDRVHVTGNLRPVPQPIPGWMKARHLSGRMTVRAVEGWRPAPVWWRAANKTRTVLVSGARHMDRRDRSLFAGFVLGDGREQPVEVADDFRASGLSHLLVVSGQNVAFVLTIAGPVLRWLPRHARLLAVLAVLGAFGLVTRWEPSVLRAATMAAIAVAAKWSGRQISRLRVLCLTASVLLMIDPMLVHSAGFALSVGACVGIAVLSERIERLLLGTGPLRAPLAVTLAAQVGTAPVLIASFGGVPLVSLAANLVALPFAEPLMIWGLAAGAVAGLAAGLGEGGVVIATVLHVPSVVMIRWVAMVARVGAALPIGSVAGPGALAASGALAAMLVRSRGRPRRSTAVFTVAVLCSSMAWLSGARSELSERVLDGGVRVWRAEGRRLSTGTTIAVIGPGLDARDALPALRAAHIGRLDVVVVTGGGVTTGRELRAVLSRHRAGLVVVPADGRIGGLPGRVVLAARPVRVRAGHWVVSVRPAAAGKLGLMVEVLPRARGPTS